MSASCLGDRWRSISPARGRSLRAALALLLAALPVAALSAEENPLVRVGLGQPRAAWVMSGVGGRMVLAGPNARTAIVAGGGRAECSVDGEGWTVTLEGATWHLGPGATVTAAPGEEAVLGVGVGARMRKYRGSIVVSRAAGGLRLTNVLSLEDYLRGVLPPEIPRTFHPQALRAQAVVSRTFALRRLGAHGRDGYDFCDTTHCQVYLGASAETAQTDEALAATRGIALAYGGEFIDAVYHPTCGGATAAKEAIWPGHWQAPYLCGVSDDLNGQAACAASPHFRWEATLSREQLGRIMGILVETFQVMARHPCGRVLKVRGRGSAGAVEISGYDFYRRASAAGIKSAWFEVEPAAGGWRFTGRGLGHGVGLCQWGAQGRARAGWTFERLLLHYYPGATLARVGG
jgi:stage II sporulation protein D